MKLIRKSNTIFDWVIYAMAILATALIIFIVIATTAEVVSRLTVNRSLLGVIEVTEYSLLFMTLLGTAWVLKEEGHVRIDLVLSQLGIRAQYILNIVTSIIALIICIIITWYGTKVTWEYYETGYRLATVLKPASFYLFAVIPFGMFLLGIQLMRRIGKFVRELRSLYTKVKDD